MVDNVYVMVFIHLVVARHLGFEDVEKIPHSCMLVQEYLNMYVITQREQREPRFRGRKKKQDMTVLCPG